MTMRIDHLAIWADDIELLRAFYMKYFGMMSNSPYINEKKTIPLLFSIFWR
jgi:lactoylglutathione lyase